MHEWMKFYREVTEIHPIFFSELFKLHPSLKDRDIKLCALFLFECKKFEIIERMGMTEEAVSAAKSRLKKKFKLKKEDILPAYLKLVAAGKIAPPRKIRSRSRIALATLLPVSTSPAHPLSPAFFLPHPPLLLSGQLNEEPFLHSLCVCFARQLAGICREFSGMCFRSRISRRPAA